MVSIGSLNKVFEIWYILYISHRTWDIVWIVIEREYDYYIFMIKGQHTEEKLSK